MEFSVLIPTRSRAECLRWSAATALKATDLAGCAAEVVISDNASDDDTEAVAAELAHRNLRYLRTPRRLSMRENFEFVLGEARGRHIIIIGDDDAVLPYGLAHLRKVLQTTGSEVVNWTLLNYFWPDPARGWPGNLTVRPQKISRRLRQRQPEEILGRFQSGRLRSYQNGGKIYHGCVSRELIERVLARTGGPYFRGAAPDVFAAIQNLLATKCPIALVDHPITMGGSSPNSNSASVAQYVAAPGGGDAAIGRFVEEAAADPHIGRISPNNLSVEMMTLDAMLIALELFGREPKIDKDRWAARIAREVAAFSPEMRAVVEADLARLLRTTLPPGRAASAAASAPKAHGQGDEAQFRVQARRLKVTMSGGPAMANVASAAELLSEVCCAGPDFAAASSLPHAFANVVSIWRRARGAEAFALKA